MEDLLKYNDNFEDSGCVEDGFWSFFSCGDEENMVMVSLFISYKMLCEIIYVFINFNWFFLCF